MPEEFCSENNLFFFFSLYPISGRNLRLYYRSVIAAGAEDYVKPTMPIQSPCVTRTHTRPGGGCTRKMRKCVRSRCNEATNKWMHHDECPKQWGIRPSICPTYRRLFITVLCYVVGLVSREEKKGQ